MNLAAHQLIAEVRQQCVLLNQRLDFFESVLALSDAEPSPAVPKSEWVPKLNIILNAVALEYGVSQSEITGRRRPRHISDARLMYYLLARQYTKASLSEIGKVVGRDHSTVTHGIETMEGLIAQGGYTTDTLNKLVNLLFPL